MTSMERPKFINSPFFVNTPGNWHLLPGAPEKVVREFNRWTKAYKYVIYFADPVPCEHILICEHRSTLVLR
jgi:hypothetical protein